MSQEILQTEKCEMCNTSNQIERQRRINGLQLPFNGQQIISWIVLLITAIINFSVLTLIQSYKLKISSFIIFGTLYIVHIAFHVVALAIDPAEDDVRNRKTIEAPEFDRNLHAHVIENGRCHICNTYTSNGKTKHCGLCNKCVYEFDHHCKWLNNCIGKRNYFAFIGCVTTAFLISIFTSILCLVDIIVFVSDPQELSSEAQQFFDCNSIDTTNTVKYCKNSITFLTFLVLLGISGLAMGYTMLFLCIFHAYLSLLGLSTYEYIVKNGDKKDSITKRLRCSKMYLFNRTKKDKTDMSDKDNIESDALQSRNVVNAISKDETNVTSLMNIMIDKELKRAKKIFSPVKNKVHPQQNGEFVASEDVK